MFLFKIGIFKIDYALLIIFFIGILIGLLIFAVVFLSLRLSNKKNRKYTILTKTKINEDDVKVLIDNALDDFNNKNDKHDTPIFSICYDVSKKLLIDMAKLYFPKSKYPLLELSIDEFMSMLNSISQRVDYEIENYHVVGSDGYLTNKVNNMAINFVKKKTIGEVLTMVSKKEEDDSPLKKKENAFVNIFKRSFNSIKTAILNKGLDTFEILPNLSRIIIYIVGEEAMRAFSLKVNNQSSSSDKNL